MLPDVVIIGAMKCGTSALYYYLHQHPEIAMSRRKELRFFGARWELGMPWYESNFTDCSASVQGEASPQYTTHPRYPETPRRMHEVLPRAKLIYLVRDPIERIVSHYVDAYAVRREHRPFRVAASPSPENRYVEISSYATQLDQYLRYFPPERILVLDRDDLLHRRRATLSQVFGFLGVDPSFESPRFETIRNPSGRKRRMRWQRRWLPRKITPSPGGRLPWALRVRVKRTIYRPLSVPVPRPGVDDDLRQGLAGVLAPEAERLRALTGKPFSGWSV